MDRETLKDNWKGIIVAVAVFGFFGIWMFNVPSGPKSEVSGQVQVAGIDASSKYRLPQGVVRVRLQNGDTIDAKVSPGVVALSGDHVRVRIYERVLTQAPVYEVYAKEKDKKP